MKELRFDLSEAKSIRRIRQRTESWSPLADGQIIAQGTLTLPTFRISGGRACIA